MEWLLVIVLTFNGNIIMQRLPNYDACQAAKSTMIKMEERNGIKAECVEFSSEVYAFKHDPQQNAAEAKK